MVVATTCAILYGALWVVGLLQANGLIGSVLPVPVSDQVVLQRSGANLRQSSVSAQDQSQRAQSLANAQKASTAPGVTGSDSPLTLEVQSTQPAELWVTDSNGGEVGTDPKTGLVRLQISGASYTGHGTNPQLVSVPHAAGAYQIQLAGVANGHFDLSVRLFKGNDVQHAVQYSGSGEVFQDTLLKATAETSLDSSGRPVLTVSPVSVVLAGQAPATPSPSPSPSATASGSSSTSPSAANAASESPSPASGVSPLEGGPAPSPSASSGPPTVARPRPLPRLPIPLPLPELPNAAPASPAA